MSDLARIAIYGDIHLCSKNYGGHRDYPNESLRYFTKITEIAEENQATHIIGCGDLTFGRFNTLEYRLEVEKLLTRQYQLTNGNRYELQGNHDIASYGKTERDFYIDKGWIKPSENLTIGNYNIMMVDYGKTDTTPINIIDSPEYVNIAIAHDYYKFNDTKLPNFGSAIELDNYDKWYGLDLLICGHVHKQMVFKGNIIKGDNKHELTVHYPGCATRPAFREGMMDKAGQVVLLTITEDGKLLYDVKEFDLLPLDEAFNLEDRAAKKIKEQEKNEKVDISDVVKQLDARNVSIGDPIDIISSMENVDDKFKSKAIDLLKRAMA